jgi:virulence factor
MLKVAIIGLGDIAKKAYLPVLSAQKNIEFHTCTRNESNLRDLTAKYRFQNSHNSLESLILAKPDCAFVNTATDAHYEVVKALLQNNIHVYVDKPITMYYNLSKELVDLAEKKQLILMVGFNRRYAPAYKNLKELANPSMIILQKNRIKSPYELRRFVVEDFIHIVDTLRFLFPYEIKDLLVNGMKRDHLLYHLTVQFIASTGQTAIGIMNRDSGATEEKLEIMSENVKRVVFNVSELQTQQDKDTLKIAENDWHSSLFKRGFDQMVDDFLEAVRSKTSPAITAQDALLTHQLCETIVERLSV